MIVAGSQAADAGTAAAASQASQPAQSYCDASFWFNTVVPAHAQGSDAIPIVSAPLGWNTVHKRNTK